MYIEVLHDENGNILACYCTDALPVEVGAPLFEVEFDERDGNGKATGKKTKVLPAGLTQARINIDTVTALEIEDASGQKAVINQLTGIPEIITVDRAQVIREKFKVDTGTDHAKGMPLKHIPAGMALRGFVKKP